LLISKSVFFTLFRSFGGFSYFRLFVFEYITAEAMTSHFSNVPHTGKYVHCAPTVLGEAESEPSSILTCLSHLENFGHWNVFSIHQNISGLKILLALAQIAFVAKARAALKNACAFE
jgi:hypothetical protein